MTKEARQFAAILKGWGPSLQRAIAKANSNRWPSGAPGGKGGQYAPSKGGGAAPYSTSGMGFKPKQLSLFNFTSETKAELKPAASSAPAFAPMGSWGSWGGSGGAPSAPKAPPPGAKPHLQVDDKGQPVTINYPTKPSDPGTWKSADATATFVPGGPVPAVLHGVPMKPWADAPQRLHEWANVPGQRPEIDRDFPLDPAPGKSVGAGVIIEESDGRIWLTKPTNHFGGYQQTFPKGTVEHGLSLQASAIKEAYEETGLKIEITGVLGDFERTTSVARFYTAKRVGGTPADMGWESQALRLATPRDMNKLLNSQIDKGIIDAYREEHFLKRAPLSIIRHYAVIDEAVARRGLEWLYKVGKPTSGHWQHQERWPAGTPLGGQWKAMGADGLTLPPTVAGGLNGQNPAYQKKLNALHATAQANDLKSVLDKAVEYEKKAQADAAAGKKTSHAKWHAQVSQYATQLVADMTAKPKAEASAAKITGPDKLSDYTKVGAKPGGSNDGAVYADKDGVKWLVKGNAYASQGGAALSDDRAKNEVLASKLMAAAGIPGPEIKLVDLEGKHQGNLGVAVKWIDGLQGFNPKNAGQLSAVQNQFAVHAWLGNWDVLGMHLDNTMFKDGQAINIDPGGAILFRAQGAPKKEGLFDKSASDWESMRSTDQHQKSVYGSMSASQLQESAKHLANMSDDTINKLVDAHGPGDLKAKVALASTLRARRDAILEKAGLKTIFIPDVQANDTVPTPPPAPPKIADAVPAPAGTPIPAGVAKPEFNSGYKKTDDHYSGLAAKAEAFHMAGDLDGLKGMVDMKKNPGTWGGTTFSSKKLQAFHSALVADLEGKQQQAAAQVSAGQATVTDAKGQEWKATDGVLNPVAAPRPVKSSGALTNQDLHDLASKNHGIDMGVFTASMPNWVAGGGNTAFSAIVTGALSGDTAAVAAAKPSSPGAKQFQKDVLAAMTGNGVAAKPAPAPTAAPALPDFQSKKLKPSNTNAGPVNKKIDLIEALAKKGDVKGLLALKYTTNTYGHQSVALANDALAALDSPHKVVAGQAANSHPALVNGTAQNAPVTAAVPPLAKPAEPAKPKPTFKPELLSSPPKFSASSVPAVNEANNQAVQLLHTTAQSGDMHALQNLKFEQLDKDTQQKTGVLLSFDQHPSKGVQAYYSTIMDEVSEQLNGGTVATFGQNLVSKQWRDLSAVAPPVAMGKDVSTVSSAQKIGKYIVLGKAPTIPKVATINTIMDGNAWAKWANKQYAKTSYEAQKVFSHYITSSGANEINTALRSGNMTGHLKNGMSKTEYVEKFNKELAVEIPEGAKFTRLMGTHGYGSAPLSHAQVKEMQDAIIAAGPGTILQEPGFSSSSHGGSILNSNEIQWNFTAGQGVKAFPAWLHENKGEKECLFPPNTRYLITSTKKTGGKLVVEALLLPSV